MVSVVNFEIVYKNYIIYENVDKMNMVFIGKLNKFRKEYIKYHANIKYEDLKVNLLSNSPIIFSKIPCIENIGVN